MDNNKPIIFEKESAPTKAERDLNLMIYQTLMGISMALSDVRRKVDDVETKMEKSGYQHDGLPLDQKYLLSLEEAAEYSGIGINKLREISNESNCSFVMWSGNHRKFKRKLFEKWLDESYSV